MAYQDHEHTHTQSNFSAGSTTTFSQTKTASAFKVGNKKDQQESAHKSFSSSDLPVSWKRRTWSERAFRGQIHPQQTKAKI